MTFLARVVAHADERPAAIAFRYRRLHGDVEQLTRREMVSRASAAANRLAAAGVREGDVVVLIVSEHACQPILFLACLFAGAVPTFLAPPTPKLDPARYAMMIETLVARLRCRLVVSSPMWASTLRTHVSSPVVLCDDLTAAPSVGRSRDPQLDAHSDSAPLFLQHSSGTTGLQKGVTVTDRALVRQLDRLAGVLRVDGADAVSSWLPVYHDMGLVACFLLPLYCGIAATQIAPFDWLRQPQLFFHSVMHDRCTIAYLPNFAFHHLAAQPTSTGTRLDSLRALVNCSEPIDDSSFERLLRGHGSSGLRDDAMASSYAMAENVFAVTHSAAGVAPRRIVHEGRSWVSSGAVIDGTSLRVIDEQGTTLPDGVVGELAIRGDCLLTATDEYRTGDLGFLTEGEVVVTGRKSDVIIVSGRNIHPQDVEAAAMVDGVHPGRVVAIGVRSSSRGTDRLVVIAERSDDANLNDDALADRIRAGIAASIDAPASRIHLVERGWLVKSTSGKPARNLCRSKALAERLVDHD